MAGGCTSPWRGTWPISNGTSASTRPGWRYTYTIMQPGEARCLGCLYIHPLPQASSWPAMPAQDDPETPSPGSAAYARFWVRSSLQGSSIELQLLKELIAWFEKDWLLEAWFLRQPAGLPPAGFA